MSASASSTESLGSIVGITDPSPTTVNPWEHATKIIQETVGSSPNASAATVGSTAAAAILNNNQTQKSIKELFYNGTGYYIEDEAEPGLNDLQTLLLACFATLVPLVISLLTAFGIRVLWTKYKRQKEIPKYDGILDRRASESISRPLHSHLLNSEKKCETHLSITTEDVEAIDGITHIRTNNHSNTNGSIITMTLKNNHLIVETEERNDIEEDSRETTMKYSPGARDGVFVVEVQQGVRRSPGASNPELMPGSGDQQSCALVHHPPERFSGEEDAAEEAFYVETSSPAAVSKSLAQQVRTGLAQSDQSLSESRYSYCYTNQQCYDSGSYGYPLYCGYVNDEQPQVEIRTAAAQSCRRAAEDENKPKITAAVYKSRSRGASSGGIPETEVQLYENKAFESIETKS